MSTTETKRRAEIYFAEYMRRVDLALKTRTWVWAACFRFVDEAIAAGQTIEETATAIAFVQDRVRRVRICSELCAALGEMIDAAGFDECQHRRTHAGPRVPLRWGTGPTEVCDDCGAYRTTHHGPGMWLAGPAETERREDDEL